VQLSSTEFPAPYTKPSYVKKEIVDFFYITLPERL
jgi:hypothetical protein